MQANDFEELIAAQRACFQSGVTLPIPARLAALKRLSEEFSKREDLFLAALKEDLGKSPFESYAAEVAMVREELHAALRHTKEWAKPRRAAVSLAQFPASARQYPQPLGVSLIVSPWNYPLLLSLAPVISAVSAGCCFLLRPSSQAPRTAAALQELIAAAFPARQGAALLCSREETDLLLSCRFDHIFFTGSAAVGKRVMAAAARHLTPVTLELGGKSPCIVEESADLAKTARRIIWGKFLNAGQTCVAPDYLLVQRSVKQQLLGQLTAALLAAYGPEPMANPELPHIISPDHTRRLMALTQGEKIVVGGKANPEARRMEPTILDDITWESPVMAQEIFGPILPVLTFDTPEEAFAAVAAREHPLAAYLFTKNRAVQQKFCRELLFGGGCINDTVAHLASSSLPFGGVGGSGMGRYHGRAGFDAFSHQKSVLKKSFALPEVMLRYAPFGDHLSLLKKLF